MKIELKRFTSNERLSEESLAYSADVYVDGKKVGTSGNHGTGGSDEVRFSDREAEKRVMEHIATLPPGEGEDGFVFKQTLDSFFTDLAEKEHEKKRDARMALKAKKFAQRAQVRGFKAFVARLGQKNFYSEFLFEEKTLERAQEVVSTLEKEHKKSCFFMDEVQP